MDDPTKPEEMAIQLNFKKDDGYETLVKIFPDGRVEHGPSFTTTDQASRDFWKALTDGFPSFKKATSPRMIKAFKRLRQVSAELTMEGMWKKSPGGDLYTYEGPTSLVDEFKDAIAACEAQMIEEGIDP